MSKMRLIPALFNTEMVKAIREERKGATRRAIKPQPEMLLSYIWGGCGAGKWNYSPYDTENYEKFKSNEKLWTPPCHGDDILYVRETWRIQSASRFRGTVNIEFTAGGPMTTIKFPGGGTHATEMPEFDRFVSKWSKDGWNPSIFMPKDAARIFLKVKQVKCERLQDMTVDDVKLEGIDNTVPSWDDEFLCDYCPLDDTLKGVHCYGGAPYMCDGCRCDEAYAAWVEEYKLEFAALWDSTLSKDALEKYGWAANPWVWVIEFEKLDITSYEEAKKLL